MFEDIEDAVSQKPINVRCQVGKILAGVEEVDRERLQAALSDPETPGTALADYLTKKGFPIKGPGIQNHRKQRCHCEV